MEPWQIYLLNSRTEILNARASECTSLYLQDSAMLGQTWDWAHALEDLMIVLRCKYPDGSSLLTLTDPGILAKVGMNSAGLGVCLNILFSPHELDGLPTHLLIRALLECADIDEAAATLDQAGIGRSSHLMIADAEGRGFGTEYAEGRQQRLTPQQGYLLHTNHCIATSLQAEVLPNSLERYSQAQIPHWLRCAR